jgi:hypothetical protein
MNVHDFHENAIADTKVNENIHVNNKLSLTVVYTRTGNKHGRSSNEVMKGVNEKILYFYLVKSSVALLVIFIILSVIGWRLFLWSPSSWLSLQSLSMQFTNVNYSRVDFDYWVDVGYGGGLFTVPMMSPSWHMLLLLNPDPKHFWPFISIFDRFSSGFLYNVVPIQSYAIEYLLYQQNEKHSLADLFNVPLLSFVMENIPVVHGVLPKMFDIDFISLLLTDNNNNIPPSLMEGSSSLPWLSFGVGDGGSSLQPFQRDLRKDVGCRLVPESSLNQLFPGFPTQFLNNYNPLMPPVMFNRFCVSLFFCLLLLLF